MKDFLFQPEQMHTPIKNLSGGERNRLTLARALARPSNLLVLDEPTNDLDLETLDVLQEMLADYSGTLLLVSHDRDFLDRVVSSVIVSDGDGIWTEYAGGYTDMVRQRGRGVGAKVSSQPTPPAPNAPLKKNRKPRQAPRRKLSFNEQHALKTLPDRIDELTREVADLETRLSDPALYARDPAAAAKIGQALETTRAGLAAAEDEWLRLEALREAIES